jgi:hypothetical protein
VSPADGPSLEVLRFAATPVSADVVLLELEGRFTAVTRRRLGVPRLVADGDDGPRELTPAAAAEARAEPDGSPWRAVYAVGFDLAERGRFSLAVGHELLLDLPSPDTADASRDREVRLARESNALRRTADEARAAAAAALASAGDERRAREAAEAESQEARLARDDLGRRVAGLEEELAALRREHAAELVRRDEERDAALAARDDEAARLADARVADVEAETAETRRALKAARADVEALRRELERERERAAMAEAVVPRGRVTELAGEPVPGEPVPDRPTARIGDANGAEAARGRVEEEALAFDDDDFEDEPTNVVSSEAKDGFAGDGDNDPATTVALPDDYAADDEAPELEGDPGETVRVLGGRRPRRSGAGRPAEAAPGTAAIGARHIEPGQTTQRAGVGAWLVRALAFAALAIAILAVILVLKAF